MSPTMSEKVREIYCQSSEIRSGLGASWLIKRKWIYMWLAKPEIEVSKQSLHCISKRCHCITRLVRAHNETYTDRSVQFLPGVMPPNIFRGILNWCFFYCRKPTTVDEFRAAIEYECDQIEAKFVVVVVCFALWYKQNLDRNDYHFVKQTSIEIKDVFCTFCRLPFSIPFWYIFSIPFNKLRTYKAFNKSIYCCGGYPECVCRRCGRGDVSLRERVSSSIIRNESKKCSLSQSL